VTRTLRKALGPPLPLAMKYFGIKIPQTRKDLDEAVGALIDGKLPL
jgi:hypothetical protein